MCIRDRHQRGSHCTVNCSTSDGIWRKDSCAQYDGCLLYTSKGDFQLAQPQVVFPDTSLILTIGEGEVYKGYFMIKNRGEGSIRGLVYSSSFRMRCLEQGFEGKPGRVEFEYDGRGLLPGHVEQGTFTVVCTGGEYTIPFTALIEKPYVMTNYGKVQNTDDFRRLAVKDYTCLLYTSSNEGKLCRLDCTVARLQYCGIRSSESMDRQESERVGYT